MSTSCNKIPALEPFRLQCAFFGCHETAKTPHLERSLCPTLTLAEGVYLQTQEQSHPSWGRSQYPVWRPWPRTHPPRPILTSPLISFPPTSATTRFPPQTCRP